MQPSSGQHDSAERVWGSGRVQAARKLLREKIQGSPEPPSPNSTQQLTMQAGTAPPSDGSGPQAATGARVSLAARTSTVRAPALKLKGLQGKLAKGFEALWQRQVVVKRKSGIQWPELSDAQRNRAFPESLATYTSRLQEHTVQFTAAAGFSIDGAHTLEDYEENIKQRVERVRKERDDRAAALQAQRMAQRTRKSSIMRRVANVEGDFYIYRTIEEEDEHDYSPPRTGKPARTRGAAPKQPRSRRMVPKPAPSPLSHPIVKFATPALPSISEAPPATPTPEPKPMQPPNAFRMRQSMAVSIVGSTGFVAAHVQPAGEHLSRLSLLPAFGARLDGVPAGLAKAAVLQQARKSMAVRVLTPIEQSPLDLSLQARASTFTLSPAASQAAISPPAGQPHRRTMRVSYAPHVHLARSPSPSQQQPQQAAPATTANRTTELPQLHQPLQEQQQVQDSGQPASAAVIGHNLLLPAYLVPATEEDIRRLAVYTDSEHSQTPPPQLQQTPDGPTHTIMPAPYVATWDVDSHMEAIDEEETDMCEQNAHMCEEATDMCKEATDMCEVETDMCEEPPMPVMADQPAAEQSALSEAGTGDECGMSEGGSEESDACVSNKGEEPEPFCSTGDDSLEPACEGQHESGSEPPSSASPGRDRGGVGRVITSPWSDTDGFHAPGAGIAGIAPAGRVASPATPTRAGRGSPHQPARRTPPAPRVPVGPATRVRQGSAPVATVPATLAIATLGMPESHGALGLSSKAVASPARTVPVPVDEHSTGKSQQQAAYNMASCVLPVGEHALRDVKVVSVQTPTHCAATALTRNSDGGEHEPQMDTAYTAADTALEGAADAQSASPHPSDASPPPPQSPQSALASVSQHSNNATMEPCADASMLAPWQDGDSDVVADMMVHGARVGMQASAVDTALRSSQTSSPRSPYRTPNRASPRGQSGAATAAGSPRSQSPVRATPTPGMPTSRLATPTPASRGPDSHSTYTEGSVSSEDGTNQTSGHVSEAALSVSGCESPVTERAAGAAAAQAAAAPDSPAASDCNSETAACDSVGILDTSAISAQTTLDPGLARHGTTQPAHTSKTEAAHSPGPQQPRGLTAGAITQPKKRAIMMSSTPAPEGAHAGRSKQLHQSSPGTLPSLPRPAAAAERVARSTAASPVHGARPEATAKAQRSASPEPAHVSYTALPQLPVAAQVRGMAAQPPEPQLLSRTLVSASCPAAPLRPLPISRPLAGQQRPHAFSVDTTSSPPRQLHGSGNRLRKGRTPLLNAVMSGVVDYFDASIRTDTRALVHAQRSYV